MKLAIGTGLLVLATACQDATTATRQSPRPDAQAVYAVTSAPIADEYIVRFRDDVADPRGLARALVAAHGGVLRHTYTAAIKGFAAHLPPAAVKVLSAHPSVLAIEQDQTMHTVGVESPVPSWGLDRVDQHLMPLDNSYSYGATGQGVTAYIIDTGILFSHTEFGGRAVSGVDEVTAGGNAQDCNGHGTHVSGTVGGGSFGIAKNVALVAVRVLDCSGSGSVSGVIAGVDWVTNDHATVRAGTPAVANMSLGGSQSSSLDQAVSNSVASGVTYAIAAGNGNIFGIAQDACTTSPADVSTAITVSATDNTDAKASWANYGSCVKIFAPGVNITSAWYTSTTATNTISGTSMATPHVTGAAALYLETNPAANPAQVLQALTSNATAGVVSNPGTNSPNRLLYTAFIASAPPPTPGAPQASFTSSCTDLTCTFDASSSSASSPASYAWDFGDATTASGVRLSHTYASGSTYTVTLTVTDGTGATSVATQTVTVTAQPPVPAPVASFTHSCSGRNCIFDGSSSQNAVAYAWDFGDGATASGVTASHTFARNRNYTVTLTVQNSAGVSNATSTLITCSHSCR